MVLHQINRILNPLVVLNSEESVERFLNTSDLFWEEDYETAFFKPYKSDVPLMQKHYSQQKFKTRVICFLYDKQEYREEYKELKNDARYLATRDNLRIAFVDNQRTIKKIKNKYGVKMFSKISMSSLVLKRYDNEIKYFDITSEDHVFAHHWINKYSVKEVDELSNENYRISEMLRLPMLILFVDFESK